MKPESPRRGFLRTLWKLLGLAVLAECAWVMVTFLRPRRPDTVEGAFGGVIAAGPVERFESGTVTAFREGRFYLSRLEDGGFLAQSRVCTHLGCTVPWDPAEKKFVCPCHSSVFDIRGDVVSPPAPRALDLFAVNIENGIVKVDTGSMLRRRRFEASQVVYP